VDEGYVCLWSQAYVTKIVFDWFCYNIKSRHQVQALRCKMTYTVGKPVVPDCILVWLRYTYVVIRSQIFRYLIVRTTPDIEDLLAVVLQRSISILFWVIYHWQNPPRIIPRRNDIRNAGIPSLIQFIHLVNAPIRPQNTITYRSNTYMSASCRTKLCCRNRLGIIVPRRHIVGTVRCSVPAVKGFCEISFCV
jgi:hypothetical protein